MKNKNMISRRDALKRIALVGVSGGALLIPFKVSASTLNNSSGGYTSYGPHSRYGDTPYGDSPKGAYSDYCNDKCVSYKDKVS